jgi:hypothetical protein
MPDLDKHIGNLFTAELQFRLASAVRLATVDNRQPLDLPIEWSHGRNSVTYQEIALRPDQADYAASFLHSTATYMMAVAIRGAIVAAIPDPKHSSASDIRGAYQIARLIRNAFTHAPFAPVWSIDEDCRDKTFTVSDFIRLDTSNLNAKLFDWRDYGGPLALFQLCRFVRTKVLNHKQSPRKVLPLPGRAIYQQGDLIVKEMKKIPDDAIPVEMEKRADGGIDLGGGHVLCAEPDE